jgi:hypothetical protein
MGNIGALINGVVIMSILITIPFFVVLWAIITHTKFYKIHYLTTTAVNKVLLIIGLLSILSMLFVIIALSIFKLVISQ